MCRLFQHNRILLIFLWGMLVVCLPEKLHAQNYFRIVTPEKHVVISLQKSRAELFLLDTLRKESVSGRIEQINLEGITLRVNGSSMAFLWKDVKSFRIRSGTLFNGVLLSTYWVGIGIAEAIYLNKLVKMENNKNLAIYHAFFLGTTVWIPPFFFHKAQQYRYPLVELSPQQGIWVSPLNFGL